MSWSSLLSRAGPPLIVIALVLCFWEIAVRVLETPEYLLPPPSRIAAALAEDRTALVASAWRTASVTIAGFLIAALAGILLGSVITLARWIERGVYPLTLLFQMVPLVAIAPLLAIWLGNGPRAVIASAAIVAVFPVIANTVSGLRSVDPTLEELFRIYGASRWQRWMKLGLPAAVPSIVTGLRIAAGLATIGAIVGEFVAGYGGDVAPLGIVIVTSLREFRTEKVFAAVALASVVGFALFGAVNLLAQMALRRWIGAGVGHE